MPECCRACLVLVKVFFIIEVHIVVCRPSAALSMRHRISNA